jgi:hypothetical protein
MKVSVWGKRNREGVEKGLPDLRKKRMILISRRKYSFKKKIFTGQIRLFLL